MAAAGENGRQRAGLAGYLSTLERWNPNAIWRVTEPLAVRHEITALQEGLEASGHRPVVVVERPVLENGAVSPIPVVTNLQASRMLAAGVLGVTDHRRAAAELAGRMHRPIDPVVVPRSEAPAARHGAVGGQVDLRQLPALVQHHLDPGPYLSAAHATTVDPESGIDNTAIQRAWVRGRTELRFYPYANSHNATNIGKWWSRGEDAPIALWIGHHPAIDVGTNQKISYPESHWGRAGALLGEPVRLMPTELFGDALLVPADCEIVLEGVVLRDVWRAEGPFGEYTGYLGAQRPSPVIEVRALSMREQPMYHDYGSGLPDMLVPDNLLLEAALYEALEKEIASVRTVHVPSSGRRFHCYVQLDHPLAGEPRVALDIVLRNRRIKHAVVVDEDVDVFDDHQVLWAIATRVQWTRDVVALTGCDCSPADPSLPAGQRVSDKAGIDATLPVAPFPGAPRPAPAVSRAGGGIDPRALVARVAGDRLVDFVAE
jgi:2,5-furandicarboxylate decarboxylase 1